MKKITTAYLFLLTMAAAFAQPDLSTIPVAVIGSKIQLTAISTNVPDAGSGGANQTWDFSSLSFNGGTVSTNTLATPASTAYASSFPNATLAEVSNTGSVTYYNRTTTQITMLGDAGTVTTTYSDPYTYATAPFIYNTTQTDPYASSFPYGAYSYNTTGTVKTTFDGYGTLKTPNGTFTNVIRLKAVAVETSTLSSIVTTNNGVVYSWYEEGKYFPLLAIQYDTSQTNGGSEAIYKKAILYTAVAATSTLSSDLSAQIGIHPNPVFDFVTIDFTDQNAGLYEVALLNSTGVIQYAETFYVSGTDVHTVDLTSYSSGIYLLSIKTAAGTAIKKIIKN